MSFSSKINNIRPRLHTIFTPICIKMVENKFQQALKDFLNLKRNTIIAKSAVKVLSLTSTKKKKLTFLPKNKNKRLMIKLLKDITWLKILSKYQHESRNRRRSKIIWHQDSNNSPLFMVRVRYLLNSSLSQSSGTTVAIQIANSSLRDTMLWDFLSLSEVCPWNSILTPRLATLNVIMKIWSLLMPSWLMIMMSKFDRFASDPMPLHSKSSLKCHLRAGIEISVTSALSSGMVPAKRAAYRLQGQRSETR